jgi:hypothetical protein
VPAQQKQDDGDGDDDKKGDEERDGDKQDKD